MLRLLAEEVLKLLVGELGHLEALLFDLVRYGDT